RIAAIASPQFARWCRGVGWHPHVGYDRLMCRACFFRERGIPDRPRIQRWVRGRREDLARRSRCERSSLLTRKPAPTNLRRRRLQAPRLMTGHERRWFDPNNRFVKVVERNLDIIFSRFLYPHLARVWNPYSWLLERRFSLGETEVSPPGWPAACGR